MDPVDPNAAGYDPNEPDCTNGDFFCRLCLSSQNSDTMWAQHIAGKRHIKNAQKFPNGLPTRERDMQDEDSYDRHPKHDRFDDGYDLHDDYPMPMYKDDYYGEDPYLKRPLVDYTPAVKPNIVIDYGHSKKLEEVAAVIDKNSGSSNPVPSVSRPLPASSPVDFRDVLEQLLPKSALAKHQSEVKDDFFEKINQREMAKELAKELAKKSMSLDNLKPPFSTSDKKDSDNKTSSARDGQDKYGKRTPDILDIIYETSEKKSKLDNERGKRSPSYENNDKRRSRHDDERNSEKKSSSYGNNDKKRSRHDDERDFDKRNSSRENNDKRRSRHDDERDYDKRSSRENNEKRRSRERDYDKRSSSYKNNDKKKSRLDDERDSEKRSSSYKNNDKKKSRLDEERDSEKKSSISKTSSAKFKSELDDLDPDELTPDILDTLLSAHLPKKTDSSDEICNKKHCPKNIVDLDDPKIIAEKLESLSTMEFLNIIHKKLISIDLKTPEELKKLLAVIAEAQATVCKKLPPELQELVKAKLSGTESQRPAPNPVVSRAQSITPATFSSNLISKNSAVTVSSLLQAATSVNPVPKPVVLPTPNIPVSVNQGSVSTVSSAARPQNQIPVSYPSSVTATIPTMTPLRITAPPPPPPLINVASINRAASVSTNSVQNYYDMIFSMCQNRPLAPPIVPNMFANQQTPAQSTFSLPPPPPPPLPQSLQSRPQIVTKEILDAVAKLKNQSMQSKQESSASDKSKPQTKEEILTALRNLDILQEEYKRRKAQKLASENKNSTSEKSKSSPYSRR